MKAKKFITALCIVLFAVVLSVGAIVIGTADDSAPAPVDDAALNVTARTLALKDNVYVKYAVPVGEAEDVKMLFWTAEQTDYVIGTETAEAEAAYQQNVNGVECNIFQYKDLADKQMTDVLYARAYAVVDGVYHYGEVNKYSILQYAYNKQNAETPDEALNNTLTALLQRGGAAQRAEEYKLDDLADEPHSKIHAVDSVLSDGFTDFLNPDSKEITGVDKYMKFSGEKTFYIEFNVALTGYQTVESYIYYFDEGTGAKKNTEYDSHHFDKIGRLDGDCVFVTVDIRVYYIISQKIVYDYQVINDQVYYFGNDGVMRADVEINGYFFGADGALEGDNVYFENGDNVYYIQNNVVIYIYIYIDGDLYLDLEGVKYPTTSFNSTVLQSDHDNNYENNNKLGGVTCTAYSEQLGLSFECQTDENGNFNFAYLPKIEFVFVFEIDLYITVTVEINIAQQGNVDHILLDKLIPDLQLTTPTPEFVSGGGTKQLYFYALFEGEASSFDLYDETTGTYLATMVDDGKYSSSGDDMMGDGIYTCKLSISTSSEKAYQFYAYNDALQLRSKTLTVSVLAPLSNTQLNEIDQVNNSLAELVSQIGSSNLTEIERVQNIESALQNMATSSVGLIKNDTIYYDNASGMFSFEYTCGVVGCVFVKELFVDFDQDMNNPGYPGTTPPVSGNTGSLGNAVIMYGWDDASVNSLWYGFYQTLKETWTNSGLNTTLYANPSVSDYRKALANNEVIVIAQPGSAYTTYENEFVYIICTREAITNDKNQAYSADIREKRIYLVTFADGSTGYCITPEFIEYYYSDNQLHDAVVFMDNAMGFGSSEKKDTSFAEAFVKGGANTVFGYRDSEFIAYGLLMMDSIVSDLIDGKTVGEAFQAAKDTFGSTDVEFVNRYLPDLDISGKVAAVPVIYGSLAQKLTRSNFINGSFENPIDLKGWDSNGDVRVITQLGTITPNDETKMAILTTGVGSGTSDYQGATDGSVISQSFVVNAGDQKILMSYNVVSEEPMEYVGSAYDDKFKVEIVTANGTVYQVAYESVNSSNWYQVYGIDFDGGDASVYQTNWKTAEFDISQFEGQTITVKFTVYDVGDSAYDTAALIDNVRIQ